MQEDIEVGLADGGPSIFKRWLLELEVPLMVDPVPPPCLSWIEILIAWQQHIGLRDVLLVGIIIIINIKILADKQRQYLPPDSLHQK